MSNIMLLFDTYSMVSGFGVWWYGYLDCYIHCRHNRMANVLFCDGHVKALNKSAIISGNYFAPVVARWFPIDADVLEK